MKKQIIVILILLVFASFVQIENPKHEFYKYVKENSWHLLRKFFITKNDYENFINQLAYSQSDSILKTIENNGNYTLAMKVRPYRLKDYTENSITLEALDTAMVVKISFDFDIINLKITSYSFNKQ